MNTRQYLSKSTVLMLHYNDLVSYVMLQSLCQFSCFKTESFLCIKLYWLWRGRWKSLSRVAVMLKCR